MRAAAALLVAAVVLGPVTEAAADGLAAVSFTAESGMAGVSSSRNASTSSTGARNGAAGLVLAATQAPSYAQWTSIPQGRSHAVIRLWVRVLRRGAGQSVDLVTVANARGSAHFDLFVNGNNQRLQWDLYRDDTDSTGAPLVYGRWYLVEARVEFRGTEHTAQVRIDGVDQGTIRSAGTSTTVRLLNVGTTLAKTHTQHYDDVGMRVGDTTLAWLTGPG